MSIWVFFCEEFIYICTVDHKKKHSFDRSVEKHSLGEQVPSFDWSGKA